jgi:hypothetical protein
MSEVGAIFPSTARIQRAHMPGPGGVKTPFVVLIFELPGAPEPLTLGLVPIVARETAYRLMHFANAAEFESVVDQLRDTFEGLEVAERLVAAKEYDNLGAVLARIRERAEPPAAPTVIAGKPMEGGPDGNT